LVGKTILIVDENPASRIFLANHLRAKQFKILEAPTGKEGLIVAWRHETDLVLFDPALTDIPDKEFIYKLRNDPRFRVIPARLAGKLAWARESMITWSNPRKPSLRWSRS
jgi:two-component system KDP operon response regulator KdpE